MSTESVVRAFYASRLANDEARCMACYAPGKIASLVVCLDTALLARLVAKDPNGT